MNRLQTFCWDCDAPVMLGEAGWYRCARCGFESLRATSEAVCGCSTCAGNDADMPRRAKPGAGLVSLTHKVEIH